MNHLSDFYKNLQYRTSPAEGREASGKMSPPLGAEAAGKCSLPPDR